MPLTKKGAKIMRAMKAKYGDKRGEEVFYASVNKGKIEGVHKGKKHESVADVVDALLAGVSLDEVLGEADDGPDCHLWHLCRNKAEPHSRYCNDCATNRVDPETGRLKDQGHKDLAQRRYGARSQVGEGAPYDRSMQDDARARGETIYGQTRASSADIGGGWEAHREKLRKQKQQKQTFKKQ